MADQDGRGPFKIALVTTMIAALVVWGSGGAGAVYLYIPDLVVIDTGDEADEWLTETEISMGVEGADDPEASDNPALNRVHRIESVMEQHWRNLEKDCDPNAVFALMYLVTTYNVRNHIEQEYFENNTYLSIITVAFAKLYLDAYEAWEQGDTEQVPPAWLEAFEWAESDQSSIEEDQFLGMNAHINYDLAIAIAALGTEEPDGESRKPEMDRINHVLADATDDVGYWTAYYYGPEEPEGTYTKEHTSHVTDTGAANVALMEAIYEWREEAWKNAETLEDAPDETSRQLIDQYMRERSWTIAQGFQTEKAEDPAPERVAYCESHGHHSDLDW